MTSRSSAATTAPQLAHARASVDGSQTTSFVSRRRAGSVHVCDHRGPRIVKHADYGPRWHGHFVVVQSESDLDDELKAWLQEAHDVVGLQSGLRDT